MKATDSSFFYRVENIKAKSLCQYFTLCIKRRHFRGVKDKQIFLSLIAKGNHLTFGRYFMRFRLRKKVKKFKKIFVFYLTKFVCFGIIMVIIYLLASYNFI